MDRVEFSVPATSSRWMLRLGGMMKSVVHEQVIEQVGRAMDRSGVLIDPNAETVPGGARSLAICLQPHGRVRAQWRHVAAVTKQDSSTVTAATGPARSQYVKLRGFWRPESR
jgi:hypothetical protein